jgi:hypothetical protein
VEKIPRSVDDQPRGALFRLGDLSGLEAGTSASSAKARPWRFGI